MADLAATARRFFVRALYAIRTCTAPQRGWATCTLSTFRDQADLLEPY